MSFNFYGHRGVPKKEIPQEDGRKLVLSSMTHDFTSADRGRMIHEVKATYWYVEANGQVGEGMMHTEGWLNEYMEDADAHEMARIIYHDPTDEFTGIQHRVGKWPAR